MKLYTLTYDDARPTKQQVNIPTNSDYKIGIKVFSHRNEGKPNARPSTVNPNPPKVIAEDLNLLPPQVSLVADDGTTISADSEIVNGYVTFTLKTDDNPSFKNYKVRVQNDTFNEVLFAETSGDTGKRTKTIAAALSCDNPITMYPSDKILQTSPSSLEFLPFATNGYVGQVDKKFQSYMTRMNDDGTFYVSQNSQTRDDDLLTDQKAVRLTQEDIDAGHNKIWFQRTATGEYHFEIYVFPYENTFDLAVNTFKSQQGDIDIVGDTSGFYTKGEVDVMLSAKADVAELTAYATNESLSAYATQTDLANKVTNLSSVSGIMKISQADYDALSAGGTADVNTLYVIVD